MKIMPLVSAVREKRAADPGQVELALGEPGDERRRGADRRALGRREDAAVDAAEDDQEDRRDRPHFEERRDALGVAVARLRRARGPDASRT